MIRPAPAAFDENQPKQAKLSAQDSPKPIVKPEPGLSGEMLVSVGCLIWKEDEAMTSWLTKKDFKEAVVKGGGKVGASASRNTTIVVKGNITCGDHEAALQAVIAQQSNPGRSAGKVKVLSLAEFLADRPTLKTACARRLSSAEWPKTVSVSDKATQEMVETPNEHYKAPHMRTEKMLTAALMQQGRAEANVY